MTALKEHLEHLKNRVKYPATRNEVLEACNRSSDLPEDRDWLAKTLPEGRYNNAIDVLRALLEKSSEKACHNPFSHFSTL